MATECDDPPATYRLLDQCGEPITLPPVGHLANLPPPQQVTCDPALVTPDHVTSDHVTDALTTLPERSVVTIAVSVVVVTIVAIVIIALTMVFLRKKRFQTLPKIAGAKQNQMRRKITSEEKRWGHQNNA